MTLLLRVIEFLLLISASVARDTLHLGVMIPVEGVLDFSAFIPTMDLALETIENDTTLPFTFAITFNDSMVIRSSGNKYRVARSV